MSKTEIENIKALYELYGFNIDNENEEMIVFTYSNGYFNNAEIVTFTNNEQKVTEEKNGYQQIGFSARDIKFTSLEKMHTLLFNGFFDIKRINMRLNKDYKAFCELQTKKICARYEYIVPSYSWNNQSRKESLVNDIIKQLNENGAQLIILEAAAGYGKTCTSYELINCIANCAESPKAPIFVELSKNRKATLFRYVLLDEIDKKFSSLSSQLVIYEIKQGMVPLIIDGFDELLSRSGKNMSVKNNENSDDVQTMLDTIAELFKEESNCKVILTSRKSSIFVGEVFEEWAEEKLGNCTITRVAISEPTIGDWLGVEKEKFLNDQKIPFASIVNPILLSFMRNMDEDNFYKYCKDVESVISYYFNTLLDRERERQALQLSADEQYTILKKLAKNFIEYEIKAEEISFIRDLFIDIIHDEFSEYRERYLSVEEKPSEDEFATKLAGHALLNRVSSMKNDIGFINDFVFGRFIGELVLEDKSILEVTNSEYIDIACTTFASRSDEKREAFFDAIRLYIDNLNAEQQFDIEIKLVSSIRRNYSHHYINNYIFDGDIYFDGTYRFEDCTFINCTFKENIIATSAFFRCAFYNCRFYNVVIVRDTVQNRLLIFSGGSGHENFAQEASYETEILLDTNYEKSILRKYWSEGERYSKGRVKEIVLLQSTNQEEREGLKNALEMLKKKNILSKEGHYWYLNKDELKAMKEILEN